MCLLSFGILSLWYDYTDHALHNHHTSIIIEKNKEQVNTMNLNKAEFCPVLEKAFTVSYDNYINDCPPHGHPYCELVLFTQGTGLHIINGNSAPFAPGCIALLSPSDIHGWKNDTGSKHCCIKLRFSYSFYFSHLSDQCYFKFLPVITHLRDSDYHIALQLLELLYQEQQDPSRTNSALFSENLIEQILILLQRNLSSSENELPKNHVSSRKILQYLEDHFREPVSAEDVAKALNYSPKYFSHIFTKEFNIPFQEYLQSLRLNYAYNLVKYSDQPIIDICYQSGFRTPSYFSTAFRKKFGQTPRDVRKQISE